MCISIRCIRKRVVGKACVRGSMLSHVLEARGVLGDGVW